MCTTERKLRRTTTIRGLRLAVLFVIALAVALSAGAQEDGGVPLELRSPRLATFHPLRPGFRWTYRVTEDGRRYDQDVRLESGDEPNTLVLTTSSPWRRSRFHLEVHGDTLLLTRAEGRFPLLPIGRSRTFQPPLPLLAVGSSTSDRWTWRGAESNDGLPLDRMECLASAGEGADSLGNRKSLLIRTSGRIARREFTCRQLYVSGIGLVQMEADGYEKVLVSYQSPNRDTRPWPACSSERWHDRAGLVTP